MLLKRKKTVITESLVKTKENPVVVGELFKTYIVAQSGEDMLFV